MEIEFSKTRIVYYENGASTLAKNNWNDKVTVRTASTDDANKNIRIATIKGSDHGWHFVPTNNWGLYCTYNEFISLLENSSHIQPISIDVNISHAIPLAKYPGTANTTQLSFNNTIYSLVYDLIETDMVRAPQPYSNVINFIDFCRSFDGTSWADGVKRVKLPNSDIQYKIPYCINKAVISDSDKQSAQKTVNVQLPDSGTNVVFGDTSTVQGEYNQPLSLNDLKLTYLPEFLQDNNNVKVLFPGENIDSYTFSDPNNRYAGFETDGLLYGESFPNFDLRNYYTNSTNIPFEPNYVLSADIFPVLRGPTDYDTSAGICWPDDWDTLDTSKSRTQLETNAALETGYVFNNQFTTSVPQKFIKGVPLIDQNDALINHQFCILLSHTLKVKLSPRTMHIPRPLQYDAVYPYREKFTSITSDANGTPTYKTGVRTVFKRTFPVKPFKQSLFTHFSRRLRASNVTSYTTIDEINNHLPDNDINKTNLEESLATDWTVTDGICLPTRTFLPNKTDSKKSSMSRRRRRQI